MTTTSLLCVLLLAWTTSTLAGVIPEKITTEPPSAPVAQEHHHYLHMRAMARPVMPVQVPSYRRRYDYYGRPVTPPPTRPRSELFQPSAHDTRPVWPSSSSSSGGMDFSRTDPGAGTGTTLTERKVSTGQSYINNLLTGVNKKIYGSPTGTRPSSTGIPTSQPFVPQTGSTGGDIGSGTNWGTGPASPTDNLPTNTGSDFGNPGTDFGVPNTGSDFGNPGTDFGVPNTGSDLGNTGTDLGVPNTGSDFGNTGSDFGTPNGGGSDFGNTGSDFGTPSGGGADFGMSGTGLGDGNLPGGPGGSATDIFGPGLTPVALDITDPIDPGMTGTPPGNTGVIINNGPNQPPTSIPIPTTPPPPPPPQPQPQPQPQTTLPPLPPQPQPQQPSQPEEFDPFPFQGQQSDTWFWPDDVITGALPSTQFGGGALQQGAGEVQASNSEPLSRGLQQSGSVASFLERSLGTPAP